GGGRLVGLLRARLLGGGLGRGRRRGLGGRRLRVRAARGPGRGGLSLAARCLELGLLVGQPHAGLAQLTENGTGLSRRQSSLLERRPQGRKGQVALATTALDQVVHAIRARLLLSRGGCCDPRHETPPSFCTRAHMMRSSTPTRLNTIPDDNELPRSVSPAFAGGT